jgi:ABC-2 type transport system ATP-binding protein
MSRRSGRPLILVLPEHFICKRCLYLDGMTDPIVVQDVWKKYGSHEAVRGLSLRVPAQSVYGFLGPNGAGKSTTIRMILGLQGVDRGSIALFGRPLESARTALLRRIGALVEAPALYPHLTGRENLEVHRRLLSAPRKAIDAALETVDLVSAADRLAQTYSSGMKQRLGLAAALLAEPELLVLDEPTNGLDPAGIHAVRGLIRGLPARRGVTVFLSSHLLAEVEQVATHLAIISQGQVKFEGTPEALHSRSRGTIVVTVDQPERAATILAQMGCRVSCQGNRVQVASEDPAGVNAALVQAEIAVSYLATEQATLETSFLELTSEPKEYAHS